MNYSKLGAKPLIRLFDYLNDASCLLIESLNKAQIVGENIVINYEGRSYGYSIHNPFLFYSQQNIVANDHRPLFFNEVPVPLYCEIRNKTADYAEILDGDALIGRISYFNRTFRLVKKVDWYKADGTIFQTDYYSDTGMNYCYSIYSPDQKEIKKFFLDDTKQIAVEWDLTKKTIYLRKKQLLFQNLTEFVYYFLEDLTKQRIVEGSRCIINSLSTPLFVSDQMKFQTILFWQETLNQIPGNMVSQLSTDRSIKAIIFEETSFVEKVKNEFPSTSVMLSYLSPLFQFKQEHVFTKDQAVILTRTDQIFYLENLLHDLPTLRIVIAAPTKMSERLKNLAIKYPQLTLYESVTEEKAESLIRSSSFYLNLNSGKETLRAMENAYLHQLIIFSLEKTKKGLRYNGIIHENENYAALYTSLVTARLNQLFESKVVEKSKNSRGKLSKVEDYEWINTFFEKSNA